MENNGFTLVQKKKRVKVNGNYKHNQKFDKQQFVFVPSMTKEYKRALEMFPNKTYKTLDIHDLEKVAKDFGVSLICNSCQQSDYKKWCKK